MITGFNTDVKHGYKVYHVQTEDKGRNNPKIETLVYVGGEILDNYRTSYEQSKADLSEDEVMEMLEKQHKRVIRTIKVGHYDEPTSFPQEVMTNNPLEEVIADYLNSVPSEDYLKLITNGFAGFAKSRCSTLTFEARRIASKEPVPGAEVRVKLLSPGQRVKVLFQGETGMNGQLQGEITLPDEVASGDCALIIQSISEWGTCQQKFPLRRVAG